ncbi:VOC family protein [Promicromonospora sukumoe]|uniref:VOC family protein n=1 Tax=Promicromonospora sukumoe TaxID=88382 RepID=UPI0004784F6F|nr:VOC family protein [Promicromonospora sukumoe]
MPEPTTPGPSGVVPMLSYQDGVSAMDWLIEVFGFTEAERWLDDDGHLSHGELDAGGGRVMLSELASYEGPTAHRKHCRAADAWLSTPWVIDGVLVHVADVEAHFARAQAAGAGVLSKIEEAPYGRSYRAEDLEGHRWMFLQP